MFMITIENLLCFLEHFDNKIISMKNFFLKFVKVQSIYLSFGFSHKCGMIQKRKNYANILHHLNLVTWPASHPRYPHSSTMFDCAAVKQQKKT